MLSLPGAAGTPEAQPAAGLTPVIRGEAVVRLLRQLAAPAPVLLGLEDLQWADADTLAVIEYLADNLRDAGGAVRRDGPV